MAGIGSSETADYFYIYDSGRVARSESYIKDGVNSRAFKSDLNLSDFQYTKDFQPRTVIERLGWKFTSDFYSDNDVNNGKNSDLFKLDHDFIEKIVFTGYRSSHDIIDVIDYDDTGGVDTKSLRRTSTSLGLALGERFVINPQPQFNKRDDPRTNPYRCKIGRVYCEHVMNNWPIAIFQPGQIHYKMNFIKLLGIGTSAGNVEEVIRKSGKSGILSKVFKILKMLVFAPLYLASASISIIKGLMGLNKIVEFVPTPTLFNNYMSGLMQSVAMNMGLLVDRGYKTKSLQSAYDYAGGLTSLEFNESLPGEAMGRLDYNRFVAVRCSNQIGVSESFSNSTRENPLMERMNASSMESENAENGDGGAGGFISRMMQGNFSLGNALNNAFNSFGKRKLLSFAGNFSEQALVMSGKSRIMLPEIWSESSFSRSFSFEFKFHSPYGNSLSIFENTYYPFLFFLTCTLARQTGKMSYTSPFYIRVSVKSMVQIDYGMITSLSITRGQEINDWTPEGFPKTVTISIDVKDMTPNISMPLSTNGIIRGGLEAMFPTSGLSEYLGTLGGLTLLDYHWKNRLHRAMKLVGARWNAQWRNDGVWMSQILNNKHIFFFRSLWKTVDVDRLSRNPETMQSLDDEFKRDYKAMRDNNERIGQLTMGDKSYLNLGPGYARDVPGNYGLSQIVDRASQGLQNLE